MKSLYKIVNESILDRNFEDTSHTRVLLSMLFDKDIQQRRNAFDILLKMVESYHPKQHMTTAKMKSSDSYFIQFSRSFKVENGESTGELMSYISYIDICKQTGPYGYRTTFINASDEHFGRDIKDYVERWQYIRPNFTPQSKGSILYEVPEELNELFGQIQAESTNHK